MISYRIEGNYPVHNSTVTLGFSNEEPIIKVADIIANLGYKYSDEKTIYPIQSGEELVWVCERDETCTSRVIVELSAPYQAKYQKIDIAMPRGFEDKFEWKNPDEDPIIARTYVGDTNFKIQFSQVVEAHEIIDWVKIAGRDCILSPSGTQFIWKDTDPEHETPLEDITAGYVPECDELTIFVPADSRVDTVQWVAAEPIPIEQMYHKKEHMPFFPKTAFGAVFDHNGNSLSRVMSDMTDRMRLAEEDIDDLEAAIGGKVDFDDFVKRVKVNTLPVSLESEDETKYIYHLIEKSGTHEPGYYIFAGNNEVGNPIFNRIDNTLDDVENAQNNKFYARKLNTLTGKLEWKPVTGGGTGGVQDVTVDGESVVDEDGVAVINTTEFGKVKDVRVKDDSAEGSHTIVEDGIAILDTAEFGKVKKVQLNNKEFEPNDGVINLGTVVSVEEQSLDSDQKQQVHKNIGAELLDHVVYSEDVAEVVIEEGSGFTNNGQSTLKGAVEVGNVDTDEPGKISVLSSSTDPGKIFIHSGDPVDPEARGEIIVTDVDDGGSELRDVYVVKELLEVEKDSIKKVHLGGTGVLTDDVVPVDGELTLRLADGNPGLTRFYKIKLTNGDEIVVPATGIVILPEATAGKSGLTRIAQVKTGQKEGASVLLTQESGVLTIPYANDNKAGLTEIGKVQQPKDKADGSADTPVTVDVSSNALLLPKANADTDRTKYGVVRMIDTTTGAFIVSGAAKDADNMDDKSTVSEQAVGRYVELKLAGVLGAIIPKGQVSSATDGLLVDENRVPGWQVKANQDFDLTQGSETLHVKKNDLLICAGEDKHWDLYNSSIDVDSTMSDSSINPVQNKVVKQYIDENGVKIKMEGEGATLDPASGIVTIPKINPIHPYGITDIARIQLPVGGPLLVSNAGTITLPIANAGSTVTATQGGLVCQMIDSVIHTPTGPDDTDPIIPADFEMQNLTGTEKTFVPTVAAMEKYVKLMLKKVISEVFTYDSTTDTLTIDLTKLP